MHRLRCASFTLLFIALPGIFAASADGAYTRIHEPGADDPMAVHIFRLDNGLTVYLTENHQTPRFYAEIVVRAGSKHDPAESTGLAHYLEHMLFKGTKRIGSLDYEKEKAHLDNVTRLYEEHFSETDPEKRKAIYAEINKESQLAAQYAIPNEIDKLYKAMGGTGLNAHTWHEETVYRVNLPANRLRHWAAIESERFGNAVFRLFQSELETVYEEKNRSMDNKDRAIIYAVADLLFKQHPYGQQTTIGKVEHLKNPSLKNMYWFYNTYYVPNNMAIAISGDIRIDETIKLIDEHFSAWEPGPLPQLPDWKEPPLSGAERVQVGFQGEEYVLLAFRTASRSHQDAAALRLLDMILDNATAGLINLNLNQKQKVRRAGSYPSLYNDGGAQYLWGIPKKDQTLEEVEQLLLDQIEIIRSGRFEDWILPAIVTDFKKNNKRELESDDARVRRIRNSFLAHHDWNHTVNEIARLERVTRDDVVRVARTYFADDYVAGYRVDEQHEIPRIEKPQIDKINIDAARQAVFAVNVLAMPAEDIEPSFVNPGKDYQVADYHDDVRLYYSRNPINDLFSLTFTVDLGNNQNNRMGMAARLLDKSGTERHASEALKKEWYKLGTEFSMSAGNNETSVTISGLDENIDASLALMADLVNNPSADKSTLDELVKIVLAEREDAKKNHRTIQGGVVLFNRYGKDSRYLRTLPNEALQELTLEELHGLVRRLFRYKHTIAYTGSLPLQAVLAVLKKHHPVQGPLEDPPPYRFYKARTPEQTEIRFFHKPLAQALVYIEFGDKDFNEDSVPATELYNSYFGGGMSGIVFQELREARALAYSAWARYFNGDRKGDQNLMSGSIACQPDKTTEAVEAFIDLLDNMPVTPERFEEARTSILNRYRTNKISFRRVLGSVRSWERLGIPVDPRKSRFERIQAAGMDDMLAFYGQNLKNRVKLISIVGDKNKIDLAALGKYGSINEVGLEDIFVF
ncbi:MAG: insulinase family protein [Candidatus Latescibacteria bacterium]|nr:insulinase family protein [Candidatus Latescibacterota bacterium]